jgi:hypothetical protein
MKNPFQKEEKSKTSFAIRKIVRPNDHWKAYQIEIIKTRGGKVVSETLYDKPDTLQMVMGKIEELMNPEIQEENDNQTNFIMA